MPSESALQECFNKITHLKPDIHRHRLSWKHAGVHARCGSLVDVPTRCARRARTRLGGAQPQPDLVANHARSQPNRGYLHGRGGAGPCAHAASRPCGRAGDRLDTSRSGCLLGGQATVQAGASAGACAGRAARSVLDAVRARDLRLRDRGQRVGVGAGGGGARVRMGSCGFCLPGGAGRALSVRCGGGRAPGRAVGRLGDCAVFVIASRPAPCEGWVVVKAAAEQPILAAIDVGANAVRLKLARPLPDGSLETLHEERDPVRPGEGVFKTGTLPRDVADRLLSTLRRYAALCRRHRAQVRAVATSAMREAKNAGEVIRRVRRETGLSLDVVSGREEARLICVGVLFGKAPGARSLVIDIGGGSTEVASALGERPTALWTLALGAVRLSELFDTSGKISGKQLGLLRGYASEVIGEALPRRIA